VCLCARTSALQPISSECVWNETTITERFWCIWSCVCYLIHLLPNQLPPD